MTKPEASEARGNQSGARVSDSAPSEARIRSWRFIEGWSDAASSGRRTLVATAEIKIAVTNDHRAMRPPRQHEIIKLGTKRFRGVRSAHDRGDIGPHIFVRP